MRSKTSMSDKLLEELADYFNSSRRILIISHIRPDGDAVGSIIGLGLALQATGKECQFVLADDVPRVFRFLEGSKQVVKSPSGNFDLVCVLDTSDQERIGAFAGTLGQPDINIDHHITNLRFARLNLIDETAVSTTEILAGLIPEIISPVTPDIASALMVGLVTDTLGFRTPNMTPRAMQIATDLMNAGADLYNIYQRTLIDRTFNAAKLWGYGLENLKQNGRIVWTSLSLKDRERAGYTGRDDADLINILSSIKEADIALLFNEQSNGSVKVSWRSVPDYDVSKIALNFGGGGHPAASGADIPGTLESVQKIVLQQTKILLGK